MNGIARVKVTRHSTSVVVDLQCVGDDAAEMVRRMVVDELIDGMLLIEIQDGQLEHTEAT